MILKRKQCWGLSLPLINRERQYRLKNEILLLKRKVRTGIAKTKIKEKEKRGEEREREEGLNYNLDAVI